KRVRQPVQSLPGHAQEPCNRCKRRSGARDSADERFPRGLTGPVLLVPAHGTVTSMTSRAQEHVFLHELAHRRRGDLHVAAFATLVRCVAWFHPAAWIASRRIADLRE